MVEWVKKNTLPASCCPASWCSHRRGQSWPVWVINTLPSNKDLKNILKNTNLIHQWERVLFIRLLPVEVRMAVLVAQYLLPIPWPLEGSPVEHVKGSGEKRDKKQIFYIFLYSRMKWCKTSVSKSNNCVGSWYMETLMCPSTFTSVKLLS